MGRNVVKLQGFKLLLAALGISVLLTANSMAADSIQTGSAPVSADELPRSAPIHDAQGREIIPGGFVTITEDRIGTIHYEQDDYHRMVRMGANFQVIRVVAKRVGGWPGNAGDPAYLIRLDNMVRMAREAGIKTIFKMAFHGIGPNTEEKWDLLWNDTNGAQDDFLAASERLWLRYQYEPSVYGYDLLNEPRPGLNPDNANITHEFLLPLLRRLADAMHAISPGKWAIYQPISHSKAEQFVPTEEAFGRDRSIYSPHTYVRVPRILKERLDFFQDEAVFSDVPMYIGEWGPYTELSVDNDPVRQAEYTDLYKITASELDKRGFGGMKAWFTGSRAPVIKPDKEPFTWAIFSDTTAVGQVERQFITDVIVRPRPLVIAGHIEHFQFDFDTRTFTTRLQPNAELGSSIIFVPLERHYPEGAHIEIGSGLTLALPSGATSLQEVKFADETNRQQAEMIRWDADSQHLIIDKWGVADPVLTVKIAPMP